MNFITMKRIKCQKGAAAVEFAFLAPLLFVIVFGIIEFSVLLFDKQVITNASREGARYGILWGPSRLTDSEIETRVNAYSAAHLVTFGASNTPVTSVTRSGSNPGDALTVTVTYNYDFLFIPNFIPGIPRTKTLNAVSVMRME
jgi:Flp pilus assembly protein TadG